MNFYFKNESQLVLLSYIHGESIKVLHLYLGNNAF